MKSYITSDASDKIMEVINNAYTKLDVLVKDMVNETVNELHHEAEQFWQFYIDKFYEYETQKYIRHRQNSPHTGTGVDIYFANEFELNTGEYFDATLDINPENFDEFNHVDKAFIWNELVSKRRRVVPTKGSRVRYNSFQYNYEGKYVSFSNKAYSDGIKLITSGDGMRTTINDVMNRYADDPIYKLFFKV